MNDSERLDRGQTLFRRADLPSSNHAHLMTSR